MNLIVIVADSRGFDPCSFIRGQKYDPWVVDNDVAVDLTRYHRLRGDASDAVWRPRFVQYLKNATRFTAETNHCLVRTIDAAVQWTYIWNIDDTRPSALYHRETDPRETQNVLKRHQEIADALKNLLLCKIVRV